MRLPRSGGLTRAGFTLIETMVSLVILTIIIGSIYGTYRAATSSATVAEERSDLNQTARVLLAQINRELTCMYQQAGEQSSSLEGENTEGSASAIQCDRLSFLTAADSLIPANGPAGDLRRVTYTLRTNADGEPAGFFVQVDPRPGLGVTDVEPEPVELSRLVVAFNCKYLDGETDEWVDEWLQRDGLPTAVRVEMSLKPEREGGAAVMVACTANTVNAAAAQPRQPVPEERNAE